MTDRRWGRPYGRAMRFLIALIATLAVAPAPSSAATPTLWVAPGKGSDRAAGTSKAPLRTLNAAWRRATKPTRIRIRSGRLTAAQSVNYFEKRSGVTIEAAPSAKVTLPSLNMFEMKNMTLRGMKVAGDVHCERCSNWTLENMTIDANGGQEGVKVNQSDHITIFGSNISDASDNAIDFVAVQHGEISHNKIHKAEDWCAYAKGGSAYIRVFDNEIYDCGTGGFTAGQGTGLQFMTAPWFRYEAYDVRVYGNYVHDTEGAGLGVNGGYDVLLARNELRRVGRRSHAIEIVHGSRSCDGRPGDEGRSRCASHLRNGAWGTTAVDDGSNYVRIPNRHVYVVDNTVTKSGEADDFSIHEDFTGNPASSNVPSPAKADDDLLLLGNTFDGQRGPRHDLSAFPAWEEKVPAPATLSNSALPGMPD